MQGVVVQFKLKNAPTDPVAPFASQIGGICTGDTDMGPLTIDGTNTITFQAGWVEDEISVENSADISQGKGFWASAITGSMSIPDVAGDGRALSAILYAGGIDLIGAEVRIATVSGSLASPVVIRGPHLGVVDYEARGGSIVISLKSLSYLENKPMFGVRTATELLTGPDDPTNPTDPTYLESRQASQFAGVAFGGREVSLKAADGLAICRIGFKRETALVTGDISTTGSAATVCGIVGDRFGYDSFSNDAPYIDFFTVSNTESARLVAMIGQFISEGYTIIVSDGQWFQSAGSSNFTGFDDTLTVPPHKGVRCFPCGTVKDGWEYNFPPDGVDPAQVGIFAVKKSFAVSSAQSVFRGFSSGSETIPTTGVSSYSDGIQGFVPSVASSDGLIAQRPVPCSLVFDIADMPDHSLGGVRNSQEISSATITAAGDIGSITTDPENRWNGTGSSLWFQIDATGQVVGARVKIQTNIGRIDADFYTAESTWSAYFKRVGTSGSAVYDIAVAPPLFARTDDFGAYSRTNEYSLAPGQQVNFIRLASVPPIAPRWGTKFSTEEGGATGNPMISGGTRVDVCSMQARFELMECFVYAYSKFSMSSIYSTIYPFWTDGKCSALAANGDQILSDSAIGTVSPDGSIAWAPFTLPTKTGQPPRITGACRNDSVWILVGFEGSPTSGGWTAWKANDGAPWVGINLAYTAQPKRCRRLGGRLLVMFADGTLQQDDFTTPLSLGFALNDAAYNSGVWIVCGAGGAVYRTANFTTFDSLGVGGLSENLDCATFFDGRFYVAGTGGVIYRATPTQLLSADWENVSLPTSGTITDIVASGTSIVCVSAFGVYASNDGATWTKRTTDIPYSTSYTWGWNFGMGHTTFGDSEAWIMGSSAQIFTSMDADQGGDSVPLWVPHKAMNPGLALEQMRSRYFGGTGDKWNPIQWTYGGGSPTSPTTGFGIAFDPPSASKGGDQSGTAADKAVRQICEEQWLFAGEMPSTVLDGSTDNVQTDLPEFALGNPQDIATLISIQYQPFGGAYLSTAYVQNVDIPYVAGNDPLYFDGWGSHGLAIWQACRAAYLKTGILRPASLTYDSVHDAETLGAMWTATDSDLGQRLRWMIDRPRYFSIQADGNESQAAQAFSGARYKPNTLMLAGRGLSLGGTGYGVVVDCSHKYIAAEHSLTVAFPPQGA